METKTPLTDMHQRLSVSTIGDKSQAAYDFARELELKYYAAKAPNGRAYRLTKEHEGWCDEGAVYLDLEGLDNMLNNPPIGTRIELRIISANGGDQRRLEQTKTMNTKINSQSDGGSRSLHRLFA